MIWDVGSYLILNEPPVPVVVRQPRADYSSLVKDQWYLDKLEAKEQRRKEQRRRYDLYKRNRAGPES